jgi:rhodanese-related sulfurtransferase
MKRDTLMLILSCSLALLLFFTLDMRRAGAQLSQNEYELTSYIIMPEDLLYRILEGDTTYVLVDVRPPGDFGERHIIGALNLPWEDGRFERGRHELPEDKTVILVSGDGADALEALRMLLYDTYEGARKGTREVFSIEGGMDNWPYGDYLIRD